MKTFLQIIFTLCSIWVLLFPQGSFSQITINSTDYPSAVGTQLIYFEGTCENITFDVESTGPNHSWNFSQADTISSGTYLTDINLDPALSPLSNVNLLIKWQMEILPGFYYIRRTHCNLSSNSLLYLAYENVSDPPTDSMFWMVDTALIAFKLPMTYQSTWSSTATIYRSVNGIPADTIVQKHDCIVDGWGQVQTPYQQYNSLRLRAVDYEWIESLGTWEAIDTAYIWLANSIGIVFMVSNYETNINTGQKEGYVRYYDPSGMGFEAAYPGQISNKIELYQNYPNPFIHSTTISFMLAEKQPVQLEILNILGQSVINLFEGDLRSGTHNFNWDGNDRNGNRLNNGMYYYRLTAGNIVRIKEMVLMR